MGLLANALKPRPLPVVPQRAYAGFGERQRPKPVISDVFQGTNCTEKKSNASIRIILALLLEHPGTPIALRLDLDRGGTPATPGRAERGDSGDRRTHAAPFVLASLAGSPPPPVKVLRLRFPLQSLGTASGEILEIELAHNHPLMCSQLTLVRVPLPCTALASDRAPLQPHPIPPVQPL